MNRLHHDDRNPIFGRRFFGLLAIALALLGLYFLVRPPNPDPSSEAVAEVDGSPPTAVSTPLPHAAPTTDSDATENLSANAQSTIRLPTVAVPAGVEALEQETRRVAQDLLEQFPQQPAAMHVAAVMHAQLRETSEAQRLWRKCVELAPDDPRYRVNLASVAMDQGDSQTAITALQDLVDNGNDSEDVLLHYGMALNNVGNSEQAEQVLAKAVKRYPQSGSHWSVLGQAQLKNGEFQQAADSLQQALDLGVQLADVYFQLANAHSRLGNTEQAKTFREKFQQLKQEAPVEAQERFHKLSTAEARRTAITILLEAATVCQAQEDIDRAELYLLRLLSLDPANLLGCRTLADLYQHTGALREEQTVREHLLLVEPFRFENLLTAAQVAAELKQLDRAEALLKQAVAQQPTSAMPYAALAEFYLQVQKTSQAKFYAEQAVRRSPSPEGYRFLAETYRLLGDSEGERRALDAAKMNND
ncbi:tetratricopeptide repeat protein [Roseimaritima ulvae]|uniref:Tetratricopeptide repeat protein n=1 Tax=Roseimaritima ulvae TaxID=980254 RepID=A0A5B9QKI3_9BACT|nr:tetratricopeptide repeat protein [Roseimaritima ulvae]QEG38100.1 tetratricopeptide repeat protein [Roseimaritima ulvae]